MTTRSLAGAVLVLGVMLGFAAPASATLIAYWNYNNVSSQITLMGTSQGLGTMTSNASTITNFGGTTTNAIGADPAGQAFVVQSTGGSNNGSFVQFQVSTTGLQGLIMTFASQRTATGFNSNQVSYSTNGSTFTNFGSAYNPPTSFGATILSFDFSSVTALDNQSVVYIRITFNGASGSSQNNRLDNVQFNATSPPATCSIMVAGNTACVGTLKTFSVQVTNNGSPAPNGTTVNATITGANPAALSSTVSGVGGLAIFGYTGTNPGADSIACSGNVGANNFACSEPSAITWTAAPAAPTGPASYTTAVGVPVTLTVAVGPGETADWSTASCGGSAVPGGTGTLSITVARNSVGSDTYHVVTRATSGVCSGVSSSTCLVVTVNTVAGLTDATPTGPTIDGGAAPGTGEYGPGNSYRWVGSKGSTSNFGGILGDGSIYLKSDTSGPNANSLTVGYQQGTGSLGSNIVVVLLDTKAGNPSTAYPPLGNNGDVRAIARVRLDTTFPAGFEPDYAVVFSAGGQMLYELNGTDSPGTPGAFGSTLRQPTPTNTAFRELSINYSLLGPLFTGGSTLTFVAGLSSDTGYLSSEAIPATTMTANPEFAPGAGTYTAAGQFTTFACPAVVIDTQPSPASQTKCTGDPVSYTVAASGGSGGLSYQWRHDTVPITLGANATAQSATLVISSAGTGDSGSYDCVVTPGCGAAATSSAVSLTVNATPGTPTSPAADTPTYCTASVPSTITLSATLDGGTSINWFTGSCGGTPVAPISSTATSVTIAAPASTTTYHARATDGTCTSATCATVTVTVNTSPNPALGVTATASSLCAGSGTNINVAASQAGVSYQLRNDADDALIGAPVSGTGGSIALPTSSLGQTTTFNVLATSALCGSVELTTRPTVTVAAPPSAALSVTPLSPSVCVTQGTFIVVGASEPGVSYQLRVGGTAVVASSPVAGTGNAINLLTGGLASTTTFNVFATRPGCAGVQLTQTAEVIVNPQPANPTGAISYSAVTGSSLTISAAVNVGETVDWSSGNCGGSPIVQGQTSLTIPSVAAGATQYFARARHATNNCISGGCLVVTVTGGSQVVISQVYSAGNASGATYRWDYVELFNRGTSAVTLTNHSIQYGSAANAVGPGAASQTQPLPSPLTIQPGSYYLIQLSSQTGGPNGAALPSPDASLPAFVDMGGSGGKIALASTTTPLNSSVPTADVVDWVAYGTATAAHGEGGTVAPAGDATHAIFRTINGCFETNANGADFATIPAATRAPRPRNSASPVCNCAGGLTQTITDATSTTATLSGTILTDEYGPGNSYMFAGDGDSMGGVLGYNRADLTRPRVFMNSSLTGLNIAVRTGAAISLDRTIVLLLDTKPGGSTSSPTFTDNGVLPNGDAGKSAASRALRAARPPTFGVDYVLVATASGGTTIDSSLYEFSGTALSFIMTTSSSGSSTSVGVAEMAIPYTALAPFTPGGNVDFIATLCDGVVTGAGSSMSDETIPVIPALTGTGSQGTSGGTLTNYNRFITVAPVACCAASGACTYVAASECTSGTAGGLGSVCTPNTCPQQACCTPQGVCSLATEGACTIGSTLGTGYTCSPNPCPQMACCTVSIGTCVLSVDGVCDSGTLAQGPGSTCEPNLCAVDCVLSDWSAWGACSVPCGGGTRIRTRTVLVPAANGGAACGVLEESENCNTQPCPVDCVVSDWSEWSTCTATCGGGMQTRTRTVLVPAQFGGAPCGSLSESRACNEQPCPIDCVVSDWSEWSTCTATCGGGMQTRTRTVLVPAQFGGAACGSLSESRACNEQPCPVNCVVSAWSEWSSCSAACGGGTRTRTRTIITPAANGGDPCPPLEETEACNTQPCGATGACCVGNTCTITAEVDCTGTWLGADTQCTVASVTIELAGISAGPLDRCITFDFYTSASCTTPAYSVERVLTFTGGTATTIFSTVPCGAYTALAVRDRLHTLRRVGSAAPAFDATNPASLVALFTGGSDKALKGGNVNNDGFIDILDFGGYIGRLSQSPGADTSCSTSPIHPDFSGNGSIGTEDYTFIQSNFFSAGDPDPCGPLASGSPITDISVIDLIARGDWDIARGDLNLDGRLNAEDIAFLATTGPAVCSADVNSRDGVSIQDVFDYVRIWMDGHPAADADRDQHLSVQDIFTYLSIWFAGC
jgi:hypothetical protein